MLSLLPIISAVVALTLLHVQPGIAQEGQGGYRETYRTCFEAEDYACAFDAIMDHGEAARPMPKVAVSTRGGATVFGLQLFAVLDAAKTTMPPETVLEMTGRAVGYIYDSQPDLSYASGPFLLLHGELCRELEDQNCVSQAAFALQLMLEAGQWYLPEYADSRGTMDVLARAEAFVNDTLEVNP